MDVGWASSLNFVRQLSVRARTTPADAVVRAAACIALPLYAGHATGYDTAGVLVALGALWAAVQDMGASHRIRSRRIITSGLSSAVGLAIGQAAIRSDKLWVVAACLTVVAAIAGVVNYRGTLGSVAGMHSLLGAIVGSGFILPGPFWLPAVELLLGTALFLVALTITWLPTRGSAERAAVAYVFDAALEVLSKAGTDKVSGARRQLTRAFDDAHRIMPCHRANRELVDAFYVAHDLGEIAIAVAWEANPVPAQRITDATELPRSLGLPVGFAPMAAVPFTDRPPHPQDTAAARALSALLARNRVVSAPRAVVGTLSPGSMIGWPTRVRSSAVLASCILAAVVVAAAMHGPRAYWLPLGVAFIYKPELAPVPNRALHRCMGTALGIAIAGVAAASSFGADPSIGLVAVLGAVLAVGVVTHYVVATMALTAIVFVFVDFLGDHSDLLMIRFLDTAIAACIVVLAHLLVPKQTWASRAAMIMREACDATERYARDARSADRTELTALRRSAYSLLAEARVANGHARREWWPRRNWVAAEDTVTRLEARCDEVTAGIVAARH